MNNIRHPLNEGYYAADGTGYIVEYELWGRKEGGFVRPTYESAQSIASIAEAHGASSIVIKKVTKDEE